MVFSIHYNGFVSSVNEEIRRFMEVKIKYLSVLLLIFFIQLPVKADEVTSLPVQTPFLEVGDIIKYPEDAGPFETRAVIFQKRISHLSMHFNCTVMPGDTFMVSRFYRGFPRPLYYVSLKKEGGTEDKNVCPIEAQITVQGECEKKKTETGIPIRDLSCRFSSSNPFGTAEPPRRMTNPVRQEAFEIWMRETETTLSFKIGDTIQNPENTELIEVRASYRGIDFSCHMAPGDSFEVLDISWKIFFDIKSEIHLKKTEGKPGSREICPEGSFLIIKAFCSIETDSVGFPDYRCMTSPDFLLEAVE